MLYRILFTYLLSTSLLATALNNTYFATLDSIDREYGQLTDKYIDRIISIRQYHTNQYVKAKIASITSKRIQFNETTTKSNNEDIDLESLYDNERYQLYTLYKSVWYKISSLNAYRMQIIAQIMQSRSGLLQKEHYEHAIDEEYA